MIDFSNLSNDRIGNEGVNWNEEQTRNATQLEAARDALLQRRDQQDAWLGWLNLPELTRPESASIHKAVKDLAAQLQGQFDDVVVLGIGGSSLGGITLSTALQHPFRALQKNGVGARLHFVDNVDGDVLAGLMEVLDPKRTLVNVISKSGTTTETMAAYLAFKDWLIKFVGEAWPKHIVATTDPTRGVLRPMATRYGLAALPVPQNVGGRFSVFCPVGTFPAAMAGIDVDALLRGAARANAEFAQPTAQNPALQFALANILFAARGKSMTVMMPYSTRLRFLSDWFAQLWAESLGKRVNKKNEVVHTGTTPIKTTGTTDQHSQVQLYTEGPNDKLFTFVRLENSDHKLTMPNSEPTEPDMNYLAGQEFQRLMNAEQAATANALRVAGRPNLTWTLPKLNAENLAYLMQHLMLATAVVGEIWGIDTFDQPGVEAGKKFTYALMGRSGFEDLAAELRAAGVE